jgi:predicted O-methyltransferase YrrM
MTMSAIAGLVAVAIAVTALLIAWRSIATARELHALLDERLTRHQVAAAAQSDAAHAAMREASRSLAVCVAALPGRAAGAEAPVPPAVAQALEERELFVDVLHDGRIRPLSLPRLFPGIEQVAVPIGAIDPDTAHPNHVDMLYVCAIARHVRARRIFEFGTYLGRTTYHLALGSDVERVWTLDLDPAADHSRLKLGRAVRTVHERGLQGHFFRDQPCAAKVTQLHGDSRTFDFSPYRGQADLVFVDGGHTYDLVVNDTQQALAMLRPGGIIVWHDFAPKGRDVVRFAREFAQTRGLFWVDDTSLLVLVDGLDPQRYDAPVPVYDRSVIKGSAVAGGAAATR